MTNETLAEALEREHHEIDAGITEYGAGLETANATTEPLTRAMDALRRHIYLEEEILFPPLRAAGMFGPIFVMLREHGDMWRTMVVIDAALHGGQDVVTLCGELMAQLQAHNLKEEQILYSQADAVLNTEMMVELHSFLDSGQLPAGWVCDGARPRP